MKVINSQPPIPFTERTFTVEMTGAELAVMKMLTGNIIGDSDTVRVITSGIYWNAPVKLSEKGNFLGKDLPKIDMNDMKISDFLEKVNRLNK